nr:type II toxin-antitoxin system HipA family toxin [uncultured Cupriavidus sp.]
MKLRTLGIFLGARRVGLLFKFGDTQPIIRFVADDAFANLGPFAPTLSLSMEAETPEEQKAVWATVTDEVFNGAYSVKSQSWLLPAFFQGLLPEGVFRDRIAEIRGCEPTDHFEMLAATGRDLPGNVYATPVELSKDEVTHLVTQDNDSLEMSVIEEPMVEGVSVSGVQPKLGVLEQNGRYVGRTKNQDTHIIAKLPVVGNPQLPELEDVSLRLAQAAGVRVCEAKLAPLELLAVEHGYDLGDEATKKTNFLVVTRFDRSPTGRFHVEDFGQILGVQPERKYEGSYLEIAAVMMGEPSLGESAIHELLRRITVNELLGNPDMHLKNIGVIYRDGKTPELSPAYDIVGYSAYSKRSGHALYIVPPDMLEVSGHDADRRQTKQRLGPNIVRSFCRILDIVEKPAAAAIQETINAALKAWPAMIEASLLTERSKANLLANFEAHPMVVSARKRHHARNKLGTSTRLPPHVLPGR